MKTWRIWLLLAVLTCGLNVGEYAAQSVAPASAGGINNPVEIYRKAKKTRKLRKLSVHERVAILDAARSEALRDTLVPQGSDSVQRNKMIVDVVVKTPAREVPVLLDSLHSSVAMFRQNFAFLPAREMNKVTRHLNSAISEPDSNSRIFPSISCESFKSQLRWNIRHRGDSLFQSHSTSFCSKVVLTRLWIQKDSSEYKRFMTDLYYNGRATWNEVEYITPPEVITAVNENKIQWDPEQKVRFKDEQMPKGMDMVLYLTLTSAFRSFPFTFTPYDPDLHHENRLWSATAINPQLRLIRSMGFQAEKVGNNIRGITDSQFDQFKAAADSGSGKHVFLLVNSSILDTISGADTEYVAPRKLEHLFWGTHWITVEEIDTENDRFTFWEYGRHREVEGVEQLKEIIAGGIIVNDYAPE
jgi:hypothetical protein